MAMFRVIGSNGERYIGYGQAVQPATVLFGRGRRRHALARRQAARRVCRRRRRHHYDYRSGIDRPMPPKLKYTAATAPIVMIVGSPGKPLNSVEPDAITSIDIHGGSGDDEYVINGDNVFVTIHDDGRTAGGNVLRFGRIIAWKRCC
ncbi:MAG: hypothetical protein U5P41_02080 [Gammaproteobacteria bacterium]|nr:hypothetical protein [Gammaproteobacteria bacterium]